MTEEVRKLRYACKMALDWATGEGAYSLKNDTIEQLAETVVPLLEIALKKKARAKRTSPNSRFTARQTSAQTLRSCRNCGRRLCTTRIPGSDFICRSWQPRKAS